MARSGELTASNSLGSVKLKWWWVSRDLTAKTTLIHYVVQYTSSTYQRYTDAYANCDIVIDDEIYESAYNEWDTITYGDTIELARGYITVQHDSDGKATPFFIKAMSGGFAQIPELSGYITLDNVFTKTAFVSVPSQVYDEDGSIQITYNIPQPYEGETIEEIEFEAVFAGRYTHSTGLNTSVGSGSFTMTIPLTDSIRQLIWASMVNTDTSTIQYSLITTTSSGTFYDYASSNLKIINANPTVDLEVVDYNEAMTELTGSASTLVKGHSTAQVTIIGLPKKGAHIVEEQLTNGSRTFNGSTEIYQVSDPNFYVTVVDSRGFEGHAQETLNWVEYIPLTCNLNVSTPSSVGATTVTVSGNCFYGSFGRQTNSIRVYYRWRAADSSYNEWKSITASINSNNTYSVSAPVTVDYTKAHTFEAYAEDLVETVYSLEVRVKTSPVFDWGENDFNFNVPVTFGEGFTVPNAALKQLWNGEWQMNGTTTTINLSTPVSDLPNGLVLIFTPTDTTNGVWYDYAIPFFVSKKAVQVMPSKLYTFFLVSRSDFGYVGAKSLYIGNDKITGRAENGNSGTSASGIKYDNTKFILRYVLGV